MPDVPEYFDEDYINDTQEHLRYLRSMDASRERAVEAAIDLVRDQGAVTVMDVADEVSQFGIRILGKETMTIGNHAVGDGVGTTPMADPPNVVLWNCGTVEFLAVIEAMLAKEPRIVLERTDAATYEAGGMVLLEDYTDDGREGVRLPAIDFGDELFVDGYLVPTWLPVMFAWSGD
ncbi:hypothetical protein [Mycolicibacterium tusciae]|uniref:Uncharacterized protein n=1 Tax=Mycolicibacterium tusciae TaxID=75922 RepID=A0A1X0K0Y1_9MYCO|nr:hypothetical protein [Mycolicibacterium tusciae]ORB68803.1 hypothetical protein BST47_02650 [Mycolicibacterium tusciae]